MAKEGRKLELYEILAAKRAKGKPPIGVESKPARQANMPEPDVTDAPGVIIDDAVSAHVNLKARNESQEKLKPQSTRINRQTTTESIDQKRHEPETKEAVPAQTSETNAVPLAEQESVAFASSRQSSTLEPEVGETGNAGINTAAGPATGGTGKSGAFTAMGNGGSFAAAATHGPATSFTQNPYNPQSSFNIPPPQPLPPAPGWFSGKRFDSAKTETKPRRPAERVPPPQVQEHPEPVPEVRTKSPREVVFALDTALICFTVILALVGSSYFIGYKRGQEERPAGLAGMTDIEPADPSRVGIRNRAPPPRAAFRPPETDYTLVIRIEPATDELPERLELELAEALARGRKEIGREIPGFIFRTQGADPHYILAVGLGQSVTDQELNRLLQIYNVMEGINLSRQPRPYIGCRIAPIRELGVAVY